MSKGQKLTLVTVYGVFFALLTGVVWGMDVTLQWDATDDPSVTGCKVYYKNGGTGAPYDGTGATEGNSPVVITLSQDENPDPAVVEFTLRNLSSFQNRFVVTNTDSEGMESDYSNEVKTKPDKPGNLKRK